MLSFYTRSIGYHVWYESDGRFYTFNDGANMDNDGDFKYIGDFYNVLINEAARVMNPDNIEMASLADGIIFYLYSDRYSLSFGSTHVVLMTKDNNTRFAVSYTNYDAKQFLKGFIN